MNLAEAGTFGMLFTAPECQVEAMFCYRVFTCSAGGRIPVTRRSAYKIQLRLFTRDNKTLATNGRSVPAVDPAYQLCAGCAKLPAA